MSMLIIMEYGAWGAHSSPLPGARWRATIAHDGRRYAGSDDMPWVAIAWALDEMRNRQLGNYTMARNIGDSPTVGPPHQRPSSTGDAQTIDTTPGLVKNGRRRRKSRVESGDIRTEQGSGPLYTRK